MPSLLPVLKHFLKNLMLLWLILGSGAVFSQNLVPNPNFEAFTDCPTAIGAFTVLEWISPHWPGTPDYFHECGGADVGIPENAWGNQTSATGSAYVGIGTFGSGNVREILQAKLVEPLSAGIEYELAIWYSPGDDFGHADGLGMLLTIGPPAVYIGETPQIEKVSVVDSQNDWHLLTGTYMATGGETYVSIGNFNNNNNTTFIPEGRFRQNAYYYIDSVGVTCKGVESDDIVTDLGDDLVLCPSEFPFVLRSNLPDAFNEWSTGQLGKEITVFIPGTYAVKSTVDCEFATDTIRVSLIPEPADLIEDELICASEPYFIQVADNAGEYVWGDGTTGPVYEVDQSGQYVLSLRHECGVVTDTVVFLFREDLGSAGLQKEYTLCNDESLQIDLRSSPATEIQWSDGDNARLKAFEETGVYQVVLSNACFDSTYTFVFQQALCAAEVIRFPNAFSPNGDGVNDAFFAQLSEQWAFPKLTFNVFDRWGNHVYATVDPHFRWDGSFGGQSLDAGVFVYVYTFEINVNGTAQFVTGTGEVTLVK